MLEREIKIIKNIIYSDEGKKMGYVDVDYMEGAEFVDAVDKVVKKIEEQQNNKNKEEYVMFDFGDAIKMIKQGYKMQRKGWNGKNQYIELAMCLSYTNADGRVINAEHDAIGNCAIAFVGTSGVQIGWLASQADMLAEDWMSVE